MPTTVTKSIGTGGDYTTIQAWEDACPANLVTADQIWRGELLNQSFSAAVTISGQTTDSTRYVVLTTAAGASFRDNANVQTNALRPNSANGAIFSSTTQYVTAIYASASYTRISNIQFDLAILSTAVMLYGPNCLLENCIMRGGGDSNSALVNAWNGSVVRNCLMIGSYPAGRYALRVNDSNTSIYNCTIAYVGTAPTFGVFFVYNSGGVFKNNYVSGSSAYTIAAGATPTKTTNYCEQSSSPPSGFTTAAYSTSSGAKFQNITSGSEDFRIQSGSALLDVGTTDTTNGAYDVAGTARPQGSAYDVGCWELVAASASKVPCFAHHYKMMRG